MSIYASVVALWFMAVALFSHRRPNPRLVSSPSGTDLVIDKTGLIARRQTRMARPAAYFLAALRASNVQEE